MKIIQSRDNPIYKSALKLIKKKYRDEKGAYLSEGVKPLEDAVKSGIEPEVIFLREGIKGKAFFPEDRTVILDKKLFDSLSETDTSQGVTAVLEKKIWDETAFAEVVSSGNGNIVVLDRLQDPGNIGTIIRTAEAAGYKGILVTRGTGDIYSPKVVRAAAGSLLRMPVFFADDSGRAIELIGKLKKKLTVTCLEGAEDYRRVDMRKGIALVIGNEGQGVAEEFKDKADIRVKIPMEGSIESLNAAVAAGILMYQSHQTN